MGSTPITPADREWGAHRHRRRLLLRWLLLPAAVLVAVAVWLAVRPHPWRPPSGAPAFARCRLGDGLGAWCARVAVPEDPDDPHGAQIMLKVAVLRATTRPAAGALFFLEGGPGGAATREAPEVSSILAEVERRRDLVFVDQRGTGGSAALACPNDRIRATDASAVAAYLRRCFAHLGGRPELSTTAVAADDLDAVRRALGYGRIDLVGASYGATLAQEMLRRHPDAIRTAVLDGASLPNVHVYEMEARNAERALDAVLARCAALPACRRAVPSPRHELARLLTRKPRRVTIETGTLVLNADDVASTIANLSETSAGAATIPYVLNAAAHGDYAPLGRAYSGGLGADLDARARLAMVWVVLCSEPWAASRPAATAAAARGSYLATSAIARAQLFEQACRVVPRGRVPAGSGAVVPTDVPVLLLAGSADPLDPPANLRGWQRAFPEGRLVVVPGAAHGVLGEGCVPTIVDRFVARGSLDGLDVSCARRVQLPALQWG